MLIYTKNEDLISCSTKHPLPPEKHQIIIQVWQSCCIDDVTSYLKVDNFVSGSTDLLFSESKKIDLAMTRTHNCERQRC